MALPLATTSYNASSPNTGRTSLADALSAEAYPPATPRTPAYVHHDFMEEAEIIIFEHQSITLYCKSFIVFYRLCFKNPIVFALVRYENVSKHLKERY